MFIYRRFLQIGFCTTLLTGCASTPSDTAKPADAPIRIGPAKPAPIASATQNASGQLRPEVEAFAREVSQRHGLPLDSVRASLADAKYNSTVARLIAPSRPGRKIWRSWNTYRPRYVEPKRIQWGVDFWQDNARLLARAEQRYGVPAKIIAAIIGVETVYGRNMGSFRVVDALSTLAFDYPQPAKPERIELFRNQLGDFLTLVMDGKLEPDAKGSYAGAIGMPQFMPGSILNFAVDGDDDGHIDLANSVEDAVMSVGNFLIRHGWRPGAPVFAPVALPPNPKPLVDGGLSPTLDWSRLQAAGARLAPGARSGAAWQDMPLGVIDLPEEARKTAVYRTATPNFFALTQYNRSYFYATAVSDLADELEARVRP